MIELVAFDMAGTTIDDHGLVYQALRRSVEELGATVAESDLQTWMGTDKVEAITQLAKLGGVTASKPKVKGAFDRFRAILAELYAEQPPTPLPGVLDVFAELHRRGIKVALTTGFDNSVAKPLLDSLGWSVGDQLDAVVTTSDVPAGRPAPYLIHHAMEKTGVADVRRVIAVGDTLVDLQAGTNAGVVAVGVASGQLSHDRLAQEPHDHVLLSVAELLSIPELA